MSQPYVPHRPKNGFTLVETLAVLMIVAIAASFAIPMYSDYQTRSKISEALTVSRKARLYIDEAIATSFNGDRPSVDTLNAWVNRFASSNPTETHTYVESAGLCAQAPNEACKIDSDAAGDIRIRFNPRNLPLNAQRKTLYLVPFVKTSVGTETLLNAMAGGRSAIGAATWVCFGEGYTVASETGNVSAWKGAATLPEKYSPPNCR